LAKGIFDRTYISRIESDRIIPPLETLRLVADRLEVSILEIIGDGDMDVEHLRQGRYALHEGLRIGSVAKVQYAWELLIEGPWCDDLLQAALFLVRNEGYRADVVTIVRRTLGHYDQTAAGVPPWELMIQLGNAYLHLRQWSYAIEAYQEVLRNHPPAETRVRAVNNVATAYLRAGQSEIARRLFEMILRDPEKKSTRLLGQCHHSLGTSYYIIGHIQEARHHTTQSLALYQSVDLTKWHEAYQNLGILLAAGGQYDEAETKITRALGFYQEHYHLASMASAYEDLSRIALTRKQFSQALSNCEKGLELPVDQSNPIMWANLLQLKSQILPLLGAHSGDLAVAAEILRQLI
jgi:tetratricopeptide (TPR) repeat protein